MRSAVLVAIPLILTPVYLFVDPVSVPMLERYVTGRPVVRQWRDLAEISDRLKASVILSEDGQFCRHWGVDLGALREEVERFMEGEDARGASTITMQVARNLFLWNGQSVVRKALEVPLAVYVDLVLPKQRIMEIYLNIAEWGPRGSSAWRRAPSGRSGSNRRTWTGARRRCWSRPCPIRCCDCRAAVRRNVQDCRDHRAAGGRVWRAGELRRGGWPAGAVATTNPLAKPPLFLYRARQSHQR